MSLPGKTRKDATSPVPEEDSASDEDPSSSDEDMVPDFEENTPKPQHSNPNHLRTSSLLLDQEGAVSRPKFVRGASVSTLKVHRRARLAEKLKEIFELDGIHEVWAGNHVHPLNAVEMGLTGNFDLCRNALLVAAISPYVAAPCIYSSFSLIADISASGVHVFDGQLFMFLRAHAIERGNHICLPHIPT